jgi:tetratricopeptide (TPR) repeat protein
MQTPPDAPKSLKRLAVLVAAGLIVAPVIWLFSSLQAAHEAIAAGATELDAGSPPAPAASSAPAPEPALPPKPEPAWQPPATPAERKIAQARSVELAEPARARALLREALTLDPNNERALRSLAAKLLIDEAHQQAAELSERCLALNATNFVCRQVRDQAFPYDKVQEVAEGATEACLRKDPKSLPCLYAKVNFALTRQNPAGARAALDELARQSQDSPLTHIARGRIEASQGNYAEARVLLELGCRMNVTQGCFRADVLRAEGF